MSSKQEEMGSKTDLKKQIEARLEEIDIILETAKNRRADLRNALEETEMIQEFDNKIEFDNPIPKDARPVKNFLIPKILEFYKEKHRVHYNLIEKTGFIYGLEFSKCDDYHKKEITRASQWTQKVLNKNNNQRR